MYSSTNQRSLVFALFNKSEASSKRSGGAFLLRAEVRLKARRMPRSGVRRVSKRPFSPDSFLARRIASVGIFASGILGENRFCCSRTDHLFPGRIILRNNRAAGDNQLHTVANRHIELDDILFGQHQKKTACRIRRRRNENIVHLAGGSFLDFSSGSACSKADGKDARPRLLDQNDFLENRFVLFAERLHDLCDRFISRVDKGQAIDDFLRRIYEKSCEEPAGDVTEKSDRDQGCQGCDKIREEG